VDAVGLEVSCETAVMACSLVVPGGVCIAVVVFSAFSLSACFGGMIVHDAVYASVLLTSVSWSTPSSVSSSATATISATGVWSRSGGCISDFFEEGCSLGIFADCIYTLLGRGSGDPLFKDLDGRFISI